MSDLSKAACIIIQIALQGSIQVCFSGPTLPLCGPIRQGPSSDIALAEHPNSHAHSFIVHIKLFKPGAIGCCTQPQQQRKSLLRNSRASHFRSDAKLARWRFHQMSHPKPECHCGQLTATGHCSCGRKAHQHLPAPRTPASTFAPTADHNKTSDQAGFAVKALSRYSCVIKCCNRLQAVVHRIKKLY